jgi:hypothetical protein
VTVNPESPEYIQANTGQLGDDDLERLAVLFAWEASAMDCPEPMRRALFGMAGQCREIYDRRSIAATEKDVTEE